MDAEISLENWCKNNNIDCGKISDDIWDSAVREVEDAMDECLKHFKDKNLEDATLIITQELEEHPEWKIDNALSTKGETQVGKNETHTKKQNFK